MIKFLNRQERKQTREVRKSASKQAGRRGKCECDICLRGLVKYFGAEAAGVTGVTFDLIQGEIAALLGPSGCGKTTTLRLIAGFEQLDAGEIEIQQRIVAGPGLHLPPEQRHVGMVFQDYALFPHLTVEENVRFGLQNYANHKGRRVAAVLDLVGLNGFGRRFPHELSGGQQQRVALARALAPEPHLILMDEPFSNLDASLRTRVRAEIRAILREEGATAIFVTHDQEEALSLVDKVVVMMDGAVQQVATPIDLYYKPATKEVASFVGEANFLPGRGRGFEVDTELGTFQCINPAKGKVEVMIRPESISLCPTEKEAAGKVCDSLFFGHDQLVTVHLDSGTTVKSRIVGGLHHFMVGQPVRIETNGLAMTYKA